MNSEFTIAVHSLVLLAYRLDHMATSDMIAANVCTHPARVRKVMSCLKKQGYVATKEGTGGGYALNCNPAEVTLAQIYRATSIGSLKPSWCSGNEEEDCMIACNMADVMDQIFSEAEEQMLAFLSRVTIHDVLNRIREVQSGKT
ncbi:MULTISPECIES: RrF2 family transcriptional regulator [Paenibacillus]|uniref:Rrf2 family transcriptional regulator n=1 Tax=Paenibacillus naphthalenovorans TaxID=162209 RepID=A0A0U2WA10_9BACL|nr:MULTISPECIES: Rrf2 family transcriptional regulator [Paenibacillus]ALS25332.1 Rrf2 family transcriptional regulator [Paenibacillus naphthalenovorans]NTZ20237.1 Rrf2 family transcriptional regulator [Paenibacillus sp. JMULE4]SDJ63775.1 Rrf2 family protein [Paenibacillus naphthalenovorans]